MRPLGQPLERGGFPVLWNTVKTSLLCHLAPQIQARVWNKVNTTLYGGSTLRRSLEAFEQVVVRDLERRL